MDNSVIIRMEMDIQAQKLISQYMISNEKLERALAAGIKNKRTPTALLTGDWHIRETIPECRLDDFWKAQWEKIDFISDLQKKYNCPIIHSGDLFDTWHPSLYLVSETIKHIPDQFYTVYGNHDLPAHNLEMAHKSGINLLREAGKLQVLSGTHWGKEPGKALEMIYDDFMRNKILVWHTMTYTGKLPYPGCTDTKAEILLKKYKGYQLILTGHNHKSFTASFNGRLLVNPGSITRQTADQDEHNPCVYLWYTSTNTVEPIYLPIAEGVISREHIDRKQHRDDRIEAFVSRLNTDWEGGVSFEENLERLMTENKTKERIKTIVYQALED